MSFSKNPTSTAEPRIFRKRKIYPLIDCTKTNQPKSTYKPRTEVRKIEQRLSSMIEQELTSKARGKNLQTKKKKT